MRKTVMIIGGCRSGKSRHALEMAEKVPGTRRVFIATCDPRDSEMAERVKRHKAERSPEWETIEEPLALTQAIERKREQADVILVDCMTLWASNILLAHPTASDLQPYVTELEAVVKKPGCPIFFISNEVGTGIVPENRLARLFRDCTGLLNQRLAKICDEVIWMMAGIPVKIK